MRLKRNSETIEDNIIDLDSGDVTEVKEINPHDISEWPIKMKDFLFKSQKFVQEIEDREIDLSKNEEDWKEVSFALATLKEPGRELFHKLSKIAKEYNAKDTDNTFNIALKNTKKKSPAKFFSICKHFNITMAQIKEKESHKVEIKDQLPDGVDPEDYFNHGFYSYKDAYYSVTKDGPKMVCGFTIKVLYLVKGKGVSKRIVEIKNQFGYKAILPMPTDDLTSVGSFKKAIESVGNFIFEGTDTDLTRLKKKLFREERATTELNMLGWNERGNFYTFANGIYNGKFSEADEYGIVPHKDKNYFLPFNSDLHDDEEEYTSHKRFVHQPTNTTFEKWSSLIYQAYGNNGVIGLCFYVATLFSDHIFYINDSFPLLFLFGKRQSGKSSFSDSFKYPFGKPQESLNLENPSTTVGMFRTLAGFNNAIIVLDEYKNSIDKKMIGTLKGLYNRLGRTTGRYSNDNKTNHTKPKACVMTAGQDIPNADNALFTRFILLEFLDKGRNYQAYEDLKTLEKEGLTSVTLELLSHRHHITENYSYMMSETVKSFKDALEKEGLTIEHRMIMNMVAIITPVYILMQTEAVKFPFTEEELTDLAMKYIIRQNDQINEGSDAKRFWDIFQHLVNAGLVKEGFDYKFFKGNLYVRMGNVHPIYMKEYKNMYNMVGLEKQTVEYYLTNDVAFIGLKKLRFNIPNTNENGKWKTTNPTSCHGFNFDALGIDVSQVNDDVEDAPLGF